MADETRTLAWQLVIETKGIEQNTAKASSALGDLAKGFNFLKATIAGIAAGAVARTFQDLSDTLTRAQNDIRKVTTSTAEFEAVQRALFDSSRNTLSSIESAAVSYRTLRTSLEGYGLSAKAVIGIQDTITKAIKLSGGTSQDAEAMFKRLAVAFETGTVSSRELKSMITEMPDVFKAMGDSSGQTIPQLQALAKAGKLTAQDLLDVLGGAAARIEEQFSQRIPTIGEAFGQLKTSLVSVWAEFDKATGISAALSKAILALADDIKDLPNQLKTIAVNVQEMFALAVFDVTAFFQKALNTVREWLAQIGAYFSKAIPDWKWLGTGVAEFKKNMQDTAQIAAQSNASIAASTAISRAKIVDDYAKKRAAIGGTNDAILELTVSASRMPPPQAQAAADAYTKAFEGLSNEVAKLRDRQAALSVEMRNGVQASKEYTVAADARRRVEEIIAGLKDATPEQIANLQALGSTYAAVAIQAARYENSVSLVNAAIEAGTTEHEKAAEKFQTTSVAVDQLAKSGDLVGAKLDRARRGLEEYAKAADPARKATEDITKWLQQAQDESAKLAIKNQALAISLTQGDAAARAYTNQQEARLAVEQKIRDASDADRQYLEARRGELLKSAEAAAAAKTASENYAEGVRLVTDAITFGTSSQEAMQRQIQATRDAMAQMKLPPETIAAVTAGMKRMADAVSPIKTTFVDAVKTMGSSLVNFVIDGTQSFGEFAASVIKDIGQMIAQMLMLQALKAAFGGSSFGFMFGAKGMVVDRGNVIPFQHGGIVEGPTTFPLARNARGMMGEAGPEAVMPLARLPGGDLGVKAQPMNLQLINNTGVNATAHVKAEADRTQLILEAAELGATWAQGRFNSSVNSGYGASATSLQRTYGLTRRKA